MTERHSVLSTRVSAAASLRPRGYTLVEILIVVVILGIAGAMVIPSMAQTGVLRIQASVRTLVSDITFAQADAMAFQSRRVVSFGRVARWDGDSWEIVAGNGYTLYAPPPGAAAVDYVNDFIVDPAATSGSQPDRPYSRDFSENRFAGAVISNIDFNGGNDLIFDELGGPVRLLQGDDPGVSGTLEISGPNARFSVSVEAYTGRVTVTRLE